MLNLPIPPQTRISRQLNCVSCQEQFIISEDDPSRERRYSNNWQLPTNHYPDIQLRYQPNRSRRATLPEVHAIPDTNDQEFREWSNERRELLHCPRCGTDNRNWLNILNPPHIAPTGIISALLPQKTRIWRERFPIAFMGAVVVALCFLLVALLFLTVTSHSVALNGILMFFIIVAVVAITSELTQQKKALALRENRHLRKIKNVKHKDVELGYWLRGFSFVFIVAIIIPLLFFQVAPRVLRTVVMIISDDPVEVVDNVAAPYLQTLDESLVDLPDEVQEMTKDLIVTIESIPDGNNEAIARLLGRFSVNLDNVLDEAAQSLHAETIPQIQALKTIIDDAKTAVQTAQNKEMQTRINEAGASLGYLALWELTVGLAGFLSVFTSMRALKDYVNKIDNQLPPPIFYSVANMTRVIVWEAKHALEMGDAVQKMQWTAVQRNEQGGITLQGIHRDHNNTAGDPLTTRVLAQRYEIKSDRWGHILEAEIKAARVLQQPRPFQPREAALEDEFFSTVPNKPVEQARP